MKDSSLTSFHELGLAEPIARALAEEKYVTPTPIQAQTIPQVLAGPRRRRHRPDRHRQDRGLRAADPPSPRQANRSGREPRDLPRAGAEPDPRAVRPDRRQLPHLRPAPAASRRARHRRRADGPAGPRARERRRRPGRHAGPPARPDATSRAVTLDQRRDLRARRSRPHARHGLHPRHPQDRRASCRRKRQTLFFSATMPREIAELASRMLQRSGRASR